LGISSGFTPTTASSANPAKTFAIPVCASGGGKEDWSGGNSKEDCGSCWVPVPAAAAGGVAKLNMFADFGADEEKNEVEFEVEEEEEEVLYA